MSHETFLGQVIVISGGSSGIGRALAQSVVDRGAARVMLIGRDRARLDSAVASIGPAASGHVLDVTREEDVAAFFATLDGIDHIVTAAAGTVRGAVTEAPVQDVRQIFESKYWGQYHFCKYGAPKLKPHGSIVLFSGFPSRKALANASGMAAVDGAIEALARTLAIEVAPRRVNSIVPGIINTPLWEARMDPAEQEAYFRKVGESLLVGRGGTPEDIAHACRFLMENTFVTGATLDVDGGQR